MKRVGDGMTLECWKKRGERGQQISHDVVVLVSEKENYFIILFSKRWNRLSDQTEICDSLTIF